MFTWELQIDRRQKSKAWGAKLRELYSSIQKVPNKERGIFELVNHWCEQDEVAFVWIYFISKRAIGGDMLGDDQEPSMVFQPWRFEPLGKNSETGHRRCDFDGDEWAFTSVTVIVPITSSSSSSLLGGENGSAGGAGGSRCCANVSKGSGGCAGGDNG
ncbi:hypothetical protein ACROYT_G014091 [Oculina patagonica]